MAAPSALPAGQLPSAPSPDVSPAPNAEASKIATEPVIHADDAGDRSIGEFADPAPVDDNPEANIRKPNTLVPKKEPVKELEIADPNLEKNKKPEPAKERPDVKAEDFNPEKASPKQLREAFAKTRARAAALEKELGEIKAKPSVPADDPEKKIFQEKLTAAEKRQAELLEDLKFVDFERHPDFKANYQQPFEDAYNAGRSHVMRMSVTLPDGTTRKGTAEDFDSIASKAVQDYDSAVAMAEEMFGPTKAATVMHKLDTASERFQAKEKARAEWKLKGNEREKARLADQEKFQASAAAEAKQFWEQSTSEAAEKYKQWSAPVEGDDEGNALLEKGYKLASEAFSSFDVMSPKLDKQQRAALVAKHAAVFNKSAWFDRLAFKHSAAIKEVKALQAKLKEFEGSVPRGGEGGHGGTSGGDDSDESIAAFLAKRA
jgi:2-oxo-4-hydroxy-4-carboxy--5-ureidoimidazoline (OHCU) decarboxylase